MNGVNTFVVAAWPAAGKSVATTEMIGELSLLGVNIDCFSDKDYLLSQVEHEIVQVGKQVGGSTAIEVDNFTLLNPGEDRRSWQIKFKRSFTLNEAHRTMFASIAEMQRRSEDISKIVVELAYGENAVYPDGPLRQNARDFLDQFAELGILDTSAFVDVYSGLRFRGPQNEGRKKEVGFIPTDEFYLYFKDVGGFTDDDKARLGGRYMQIRNEGISKEQYQLKVREAVRSFIVPIMNAEGQYYQPETPRRGSRKES